LLRPTLPRALALATALALAAAAPAAAQSSLRAASPVAATTGFVGEVVAFTGTAKAGTRVLVERQTTRGWTRTAAARVGGDGAFVARWRATQAGRFPVRIRTTGRSRSAQATAPAGQLVVFRRVRATWYGPGLYGNTTACGQVLTEDLMGVAHRTLPCGTPVELVHGDRTLTVPVLDRGPYANGAHYDLTAAVARNLGFEGTADVGVLPQRGQTMDPPP
jgi:rare lipoprotein A